MCIATAGMFWLICVNKSVTCVVHCCTLLVRTLATHFTRLLSVLGSLSALTPMILIYLQVLNSGQIKVLLREDGLWTEEVGHASLPYDINACVAWSLKLALFFSLYEKVQ